MMYLEGLGLSSIGRILGVSHLSGLNWVRCYVRKLSSACSEKPVQIMEFDELHSYVVHKKTTNGFGLALVESKENVLFSLSAIEAQKQDQSYGIKSVTCWKI